MNLEQALIEPDLDLDPTLLLIGPRSFCYLLLAAEWEKMDGAAPAVCLPVFALLNIYLADFLPSSRSCCAWVHTTITPYIKLYIDRVIYKYNPAI